MNQQSEAGRKSDPTLPPWRWAGLKGTFALIVGAFALHMLGLIIDKMMQPYWFGVAAGAVLCLAGAYTLAMVRSVAEDIRRSAVWQRDNYGFTNRFAATKEVMTFHYLIALNFVGVLPLAGCLVILLSLGRVK